MNIPAPRASPYRHRHRLSLRQTFGRQTLPLDGGASRHQLAVEELVHACIYNPSTRKITLSRLSPVRRPLNVRSEKGLVRAYLKILTHNGADDDLRRLGHRACDAYHPKKERGER